VTTREPQVLREEPARGADPAGNERLTAMTGAVLLVLFAAECFTLLDMGKYLTLHVFLGLLLLGPVCLKICSTLWRFTRYYTRSVPYVRRGPPAPLQRVTGPFVILTTVAVLSTGIMLGIEGPGNGNWDQLHHMSFLAWAAVMLIHLTSYVPKLPRLLSGRVNDTRLVLAARPTRWLLLCAFLGASLALAFATYHTLANGGGNPGGPPQKMITP
jgi:hypothetical protein